MINVVAALLTLPDGRFVMQRRSGNMAFAPLKLGFFGAKVEEGESPQQAALRALALKTTLDTSVLKPELIAQADLHEEDVHMFVVKVPIETIDFTTNEGRAQVHTLDDLRNRIDLTPSLERLVGLL
jgi:ADP-ribose pyrophosphatase YjhB (NUDIX family)